MMGRKKPPKKQKRKALCLFYTLKMYLSTIRCIPNEIIISILCKGGVRNKAKRSKMAAGRAEIQHVWLGNQSQKCNS